MPQNHPDEGHFCNIYMAGKIDGRIINCPKRFGVNHQCDKLEIRSN